MRPPELTERQVECLSCALSDTDNRALERLLRVSEASDVEGIVVAINEAQGFQRTVLLAVTRQALVIHRKTCPNLDRPCRE